MLKRLLRVSILVSILLLAACTDASSVENADGAAGTENNETTDSAGDESPEGSQDQSTEDGSDGEDGAETDDNSAADAQLSGAGAADLEDPYVGSFGNGGYDVSHYDLDLTWDPDDERLDGLATISATATQDLTQFNLDLVGLTVDEVQVDGAAAEFSHVDPELTVTPTAVLNDGQEFTVTVTYGGQPGVGLGRGPGIEASGWQTEDGYIYVAGEPVAAATFHPANDHPSDKASFTYRITAPADLHVAANGTQKSVETSGDQKTWVFDQPFPQTTYLTTILIGSFETVEAGESKSGVRIRNVYDTELTAAAAPIFDLQADMIDVFEELFGPYPFDVYGSAVVKDSFGGALETQTLSIFGQDVVGFGGFAEIIIAHELAHQWFGNAVSVERWEDLWLNEGFASYAEVLWQEKSNPDFSHDEWITDTLSFGSGLEERVQAHPVENLFGIQIYQRGALALHALRLEVGDDIFFELLQTWVERFGGGNATTGDFEALAEELSGKELTPLLDAWIRTAELPDSLGEVRLNVDAGDAFFTLDQLRAALGQYAACMTEQGATFGGDPAEDEPAELAAEVARLEQASPEAHESCRQPLQELGL